MFLLKENCEQDYSGANPIKNLSSGNYVAGKSLLVKPAKYY